MYQKIEAWIKSNSSDKAKTLEIEALFENREKHLIELLDKCYKMLPDGDYPDELIDIKIELRDRHISENKNFVKNIISKGVNFKCETHIIQLVNTIEEILPNDNLVRKSSSFKYLKGFGGNF